MKSIKLITICSSLTLLFFSCVNDDESGKKTSDRTISVPAGEMKGIISSSEANAMEELYKKNQYSIINEILHSNNNEEKDAREIWFSLDEIKKFIYLAEQNADENGYKNLGVRVYLGAKQNNNGLPKTTIFFVPTHSEENANVNSKTSNTNKTMKQASILNFGSSGEPAVEFSAQ